MWGILVALISGALMSLQGVFNTAVTKQSSIWAAAGWVQATALITCVVLYFCTGRGEIWGMFSIDRKYMLLGGVMGAFITWTVIKSMDGLGPARATLLIVVTQILVSYVVEVFGMFGVERAGFEWRKLLGAHCTHIDILRWIAEREYRVRYNRLRQLENRRLPLHALFVRPSAEPDRSDAEVVRR